MTTWTHAQVSELFLELRSLPPDQTRARLSELEDPALREEVRSLLEFDNSDFVSSPNSSRGHPPAEGVPQQIGPYVILERIGQGGTGVVLLAQQEQPVRRRVAIKLVPYAAVSTELAARFEFERRALERMDHPNIARILDTGRTPEGLPYIVMEYVEGEPITAHCQARGLSPTTTIELFLQVCDGVQHAHQRGIIHRDLKPANILVTQSTGATTPRVLDFGISKPIPEAGITRTPVTSALAVGTPGYMAPEQAGGYPVDTRADVYALGAILYELIAGQPPLETTKDPVQDLVRLRESVPLPASRVRTRLLKPSDKLSQRSMLADLDRVLSVALEKEPDRRFQSVEALADDLRRILARRPVESRPASFGYRTKRFLQRNALLVGASAAVGLALVLGVAGLVGGLVEARHQQAQALDQTMALAEINRFLNEDLLSAASPQRSGQQVTVLELLDQASQRVDQRLADRPLIAAALHYTLGNTYLELGDIPKAQRHLDVSFALRREHAGEEAPDTLRSEAALGALLVRAEKYEEGAKSLTSILPRARRAVTQDDVLPYTILNGLGVAEMGLGRGADAVAHLRESLEGRTRLLGEKHPTVLATMSNLAQALDQIGDTQAALSMNLQALALAESLPTPDRYSLIGLNNNIGATYQDLNDDAKAAPYIRKAVELAREYLGPENPDTLIIQGNLASLEAELGNPGKGIELLDAVVKARTRLLGPLAHETLTARYSYWNCVWIAKQYQEATEGFTTLLADTSKALGDKHWLTAQTRAHLARTMADAGRSAEALPIAAEAVKVLRNLYGEQHPRTANAVALLNRLEQRQRSEAGSGTP